MQNTDICASPEEAALLNNNTSGNPAFANAQKVKDSDSILLFEI
jgi:hypothetical protein